MNDDQRGHLLASLRSKRLVLLLGQRFLAANDQDNPVYASIDPALQPGNFYSWWFGNEPSQSIRNELLHARGYACPIPERLDALRNLPWSCAFTSCIDPTPRRLLQVDQRRPVAERFQREDNPDYTTLPLYRLFGSAGRPDAIEQPPASANALSLRRRTSREILDAISQATTPHGRLFVEGWKSARDWLRERDFGPALAGFTESQVLIFGQNDDEQQRLGEDEDFGPLIQEGTVVLFTETLAEAVEHLLESGELDIVDPRLVASEVVELEVFARTPSTWDVPAGEVWRRIAIGQSDWRALNQSFTVLQPRVVSAPCTGTNDERRRAFREFLATGPDMQLDRVREFAFRRSVLHRLLTVVLKLLQEPSPQDHLLLVTGQSGAGKTTLLSLLAVQAREVGIPVVFLRRGVVQPSVEQLDKFIRLVEQVASVPTLVIYDGLREEHEYQNMVRWLASRGRKALVVGSIYGADESHHHSRKGGLPRKHSLYVDVRMDADEKDRLLDHLARFSLQDRATLNRLAEAGYDNFFATIYYLLCLLDPSSGLAWSERSRMTYRGWQPPSAIWRPGLNRSMISSSNSGRRLGTASPHWIWWGQEPTPRFRSKWSAWSTLSWWLLVLWYRSLFRSRCAWWTVITGPTNSPFAKHGPSRSETWPRVSPSCLRGRHWRPHSGANDAFLNSRISFASSASWCSSYGRGKPPMTGA